MPIPKVYHVFLASGMFSCSEHEFLIYYYFSFSKLGQTYWLGGNLMPNHGLVIGIVQQTHCVLMFLLKDIYLPLAYTLSSNQLIIYHGMVTFINFCEKKGEARLKLQYIWFSLNLLHTLNQLQVLIKKPGFKNKIYSKSRFNHQEPKVWVIDQNQVGGLCLQLYFFPFSFFCWFSAQKRTGKKRIHKTKWTKINNKNIIDWI